MPGMVAACARLLLLFLQMMLSTNKAACSMPALPLLVLCYPPRPQEPNPPPSAAAEKASAQGMHGQRQKGSPELCVLFASLCWAVQGDPILQPCGKRLVPTPTILPLFSACTSVP